MASKIALHCGCTRGVGSVLRPKPVYTPFHPIKRTCCKAAVDTATPGLKPEPWLGSPEQVKALEDLKQQVGRLPYGMPDDETLKWYLRDRYFDTTEALSKLKSTLKWKQQFDSRPVTKESVSAELSAGKAYVHEHTDKYGRPVIVIRAKRHITGEYPLEDSKRLCVYLLETALSKLDEGKEQVMGIFDLRGFTPVNADIPYSIFLIEAFFEYYPRRVSQVLFVDAPWVFQPAWQVVKPLMRKYAKLVRFVSVAELRSEFFTPTTVPPDFK